MNGWVGTSILFLGELFYQPLQGHPRNHPYRNRDARDDAVAARLAASGRTDSSARRAERARGVAEGRHARESPAGAISGRELASGRGDSDPERAQRASGERIDLMKITKVETCKPESFLQFTFILTHVMT